MRVFRDWLGPCPRPAPESWSGRGGILVAVGLAVVVCSGCVRLVGEIYAGADASVVDANLADLTATDGNRDRIADTALDTVAGPDVALDTGPGWDLGPDTDSATAPDTSLPPADLNVGPQRRVFVTGDTFAPSLGGLAGADSACQNEAKNLGGTWRAWLSDSTGSPDVRFSKSGSFVLVDGTLVAGSWADLTDGSLIHAIDQTANGQVVTKDLVVWTNTNAGGTSSGGDDCADWTSTQSTLVGGRGQLNLHTSSAWTSSGMSACSFSLRLYCFEQ